VWQFENAIFETVFSNFQTHKYSNYSWQYQGCKIEIMDSKIIRRQKIRYSIRRKIAGTAAKPRLAVFRSNAEIYVQLIDDVNSTTLAAASSKDKDIAAQKVARIEKSKLVGAAIARKAKELGLETVVFDRGGNLYHGRVKAVAEGAREGGLTL
jgi:large subunit ribosomal protein L18